MTARWYQGNAALRAIAELAGRFPGQHVEIVDTFDIAWSAWEGDSQGALISVDDEPMIIAVDQTIGADHFEKELRGQVAEYRRLADETEAVLAQYSEGLRKWETDNEK